MNQDFAESVARYRAELASAVTRSRRAAAEARALSSGMRREVERRDDPAEGQTEPAPPVDPDDEDFSQQTILFRP